MERENADLAVKLARRDRTIAVLISFIVAAASVAVIVARGKFINRR